MIDLASAWKNLSLEKPPYALEADLDALKQNGSHFVTWSSFGEYLAEGLGQPGDPRLTSG